ncbi:hypothetical protein ABT095_25185 [Kitasatospora sp. NPDC002227]|uniref:hypothetical protein n=1 Tax=Kitasatospora sp. NPDC002227 TaxID=3154773 RepID=UPI00332FEC07
MKETARVGTTWHATLAAGALCALLTSCGLWTGSSPPPRGCAEDALRQITQREEITLPPGLPIAYCRNGDDNEPDGSFISFSASPETVQEFLRTNEIVTSASTIGLQRDVAESQDWAIANPPYFTDGIEGASGILPIGGRSFQLTLDRRDHATYTVYLFAHLE